ncbi:MAG TPA: DUF885 domain-containing protein [Nevskiaceae bacterium]|nr:DUF885 domain-containing protein [Nevskiaceae bacterium]
MNAMLRAALLSTAVALAACDRASEPLPPAPAIDPAVERQAATTALHELFDQEWQRYLKDSPIAASYIGDRRYNDRWDDISPEAFESRNAADQVALEKLGAIDRDLLSKEEQLNYDLFRRQLEDGIEAYGFHGFLMPVDQINGPQVLSQIVEVLRFDGAEDYEDWMARLQAYGPFVDQAIANMKRGMAEGRVRPRIVLQRVLEQIAQQIVLAPQDTLFYKPFKAFPPSIPAEVGAQIALGGQAAIQDQVVPALVRLQTFIEKEALPASPESVGLSTQPDGTNFYAYLARRHTTTKMTPEAIHELGIQEVARIRNEMTTVMKQAGFKGSLSRFFEMLRTDPRFRHLEAAPLLDGYRVIAKRIDPELPRLFGKLPRLTYGIRPIPDVAAPAVAAAYYYAGAADGTRAGNVWVNLYKPETRNTWEMEALMLHEAVPGHHLQIALEQELPGLPDFRRNGPDPTAFVEGWALYAESLGPEVGLYQDPYAKFGQLAFEMWRAVRLVVDTGLHTKKWSRQKAIDYFLDNAPKSELEVVNEVDRYIADPGQALAYKIGALRIHALRKRAKEALGERFDLRAFHDVVLGSGAVPLDVLEAQVDAWIAAAKQQEKSK